MTKYDGPSYFRKNHPKIKAIKGNKRQETEQKPNYELPNSVQTRKNIQEEARHYMKTPSQSITNDPPPERFPFKPRYTPTSLQKLEGWANQHQANPLFIEIEQRLKKEPESYLLFEEHLSDEMKQFLDKTESELRGSQRVDEGKASADRDEMQTDSGYKSRVVEEKAALVQEELKKNLLKPSTGLHRSLSNIMDDEKRTILKNKNSLNKLFNEGKNR